MMATPMTLPTRSLHSWNPTLSACAAALVLLCLVGSAAAQRAEVVHLWTPKGESAAVQELAKAYRRAGGTWIDAAVAGGENARNVTINRIKPAGLAFKALADAWRGKPVAVAAEPALAPPLVHDDASSWQWLDAWRAARA